MRLGTGGINVRTGDMGVGKQMLITNFKRKSRKPKCICILYVPIMFIHSCVCMYKHTHTDTHTFTQKKAKEMQPNVNAYLWIVNYSGDFKACSKNTSFLP